MSKATLKKGDTAKLGTNVVELLAGPRKGQVRVLMPDGSEAKVAVAKLKDTRAAYKAKAAPRVIDDSRAAYGFKDKLTRRGVKSAVDANKSEGVTRLFPDLDRYERYENEQGRVTMDIGDEAADELRDCETPGDCFAVLKAHGVLTGKALTEKKAKYANLNPGMVRMNCGNILRAFIKRNAAA